MRARELRVYAEPPPPCRLSTADGRLSPHEFRWTIVRHILTGIPFLEAGRNFRVPDGVENGLG
mgnify:CR=1 FL=1